MILVVTSLVVATVALAAFWLAPRMGRGRVIFQVDPDRPLPFGCDIAWLAIRTRDTAAVCDELGLGELVEVNWNSGLGTVYDRDLGRNRVFVSPPVDDWTFVVSLALPHPVGSGFVDKCSPLLARLAGRFVSVQYFLCYPDLDLFAWARFDEGRLVRAFASTDEGVIWSKGKPTRPERSLGLRHFEVRGVKERSGDAGSEILLAPTEDHILQIAKAWSRDPTRLSQRDAAAGLGRIAIVPRSWTMERLKKSA